MMIGTTLKLAKRMAILGLYSSFVFYLAAELLEDWAYEGLEG